MTKKLDTKEGDKYIFKLAKVRSKKRQDIETIRYIKDEDKRIFLREEDIKLRWRQNLSQPLNEYRRL